MNIEYYDLSEAHLAAGFVVVIDVLRAFTTAAFAFHQGAEKIYPVSGVEEALDLGRVYPDALLMGEVNGFRPAGFDFGNSPNAISQVDLRGKTLIQRTGAGTQGLVRAVSADQLLAASFVVAGATSRFLKMHQPDQISFIVTGDSFGRDGDEDRACGEFIESLLLGNNPNPEKFTSRVVTSTVGRFFSQGELSYFGQEDLEMSMQVDFFDFILQIDHEDDRPVMRSRKMTPDNN